MNSMVLKQRSFWFIGRVLQYVLLIGLSFIILYPFITKIFGMFMSYNDTVDSTVRFVAKEANLSNISYILFETDYFKALLNTTLVSLLYALLTTASCAVAGYGLAKFGMKLAGLFVVLIVFTILVPPQTLLLPVFSYFRFFDPYGIVSLIFGKTLKLNDTIAPVIILGITGFGFRAGLFSLIFRQFFTGVPDQLLEAAYVDGSGVFKTFVRIALPLSKPVIITVFLFSFCWQWTDSFYSSLLYNNFLLLSNYITSMVDSFSANRVHMSYMSSVLVNTGVLFAVLPVIILFCVFQKGFVQGIERSGIVE